MTWFHGSGIRFWLSAWLWPTPLGESAAAAASGMGCGASSGRNPKLSDTKMRLIGEMPPDKTELCKETFRALDKDGNGSITLEDSIWAKPFLDAHDIDGDGKVTLNEYLYACSRQVSENPQWSPTIAMLSHGAKASSTGKYIVVGMKVRHPHSSPPLLVHYAAASIWCWCSPSVSSEEKMFWRCSEGRGQEGDHQQAQAGRDGRGRRRGQAGVRGTGPHPTAPQLSCRLGLPLRRQKLQTCTMRGARQLTPGAWCRSC